MLKKEEEFQETDGLAVNWVCSPSEHKVLWGFLGHTPRKLAV